MTHEEAEFLFRDPCGLGVVCGYDLVEVVDIEGVLKNPNAVKQKELFALIQEHLVQLWEQFLVIDTPSEGVHLAYRCSAVGKNQRLAVDAGGKVLIETRGIGGYVLTLTSPPECHPLNKPYTKRHGSWLKLPEITIEQRDILFSCCRSFNRLIKDVPVAHRSKPNGHAGKRPGDDYNARGDALSVLLGHGWKVSGRQNGSAYLTRPGKDKGISASFGHVAPNVMYVFSSNAVPFENDRAYDAFGIVAQLEYDGDTSKAAKALHEQGYGEPLPLPIPRPHDPDPVTPVAPQELTDTPAALNTKVTEDNVALEFEAKFKDDLRYCDAWGRWLEWDKSRWKVERTLRAFDYSRRIARRLNTSGSVTPAKASFARGVEAFCRASRVFATETKDWDRDCFQFNTSKGTLDLQTGTFSKHRKSDHITKVSNIAPVEGRAHPVFSMFLRDITLGDEALVEYLQRALGSCLSGAIQDNFLLFWYGTGQNGKNTFGDLVAWILGDYAKVIPIETLIANKNNSHPTTLANLRGLRLAVCSEVSEGSYWDESRVKSLTGDTEISARFMRQDFFEFKRTHKHLVYGNHRPMLRIVDMGMRSRLHIVPFKAYFPPDARDPLMRQKLEAEAPAILQWLIDGHAKWLEDGYLKKCSAVQAETDSYFDAQSTNEAWLAECCIEGDGRQASAKELYQSFKSWKESRGEGVISQTRWGEWMSQRAYEKARHGTGIVYSGVELKPQSVLDFRP